MMRVLICCGVSFSSSFIARYMKQEVNDAHAEDKVLVDFQPFAIMQRKMQDF